MAPKKPRKLSAYNRFIARELKGKTGPGYKGRFKAAVVKWKRSNKSGSKPRARAKSSSKSKPRARANPKGGNKSMGKSGFNTQKIFKYMRIGALALPAAQTIMSTATVPQKINQLKSDYFGVDSAGNFSLQRLGKGWIPFLAATAVTYAVPKIGAMIRRF